MRAGRRAEGGRAAREGVARRRVARVRLAQRVHRRDRQQGLHARQSVRGVRFGGGKAVLLGPGELVAHLTLVVVRHVWVLQHRCWTPVQCGGLSRLLGVVDAESHRLRLRNLFCWC